MLSSDHEKGKALLITATVIFLYYSLWVIGLPFIDDERVKSFFYFQDTALMIPAISGLCFLGGLTLFTAYHIYPYIGSKAKNRKIK